MDSVGLLDEKSFKYLPLDNDTLPNSFRVEANLFNTLLNITMYSVEGLWATASLNSKVYSKLDENSNFTVDAKNIVIYFFLSNFIIFISNLVFRIIIFIRVKMKEHMLHLLKIPI